MPVAHAAELGGVVVSDSKGGPAKAEFAATTPRIFVRAVATKVSAAVEVRSEWVAVKTEGAPPDYRIDSAVAHVNPKATLVDFSLARPENGWPKGIYRVDLFLDEKPVGRVSFTIGK